MSIDSLDGELDKAKMEGSRLEAVRSVALEVGFRHGRRWRQKELNQWIAQHNDLLSTAWNFEQLLIDGVYLPPRVDEVKGHVEKTEEGLRFIRHAYRVASSPELVITAPTHLHYLYQTVSEADPPHPLALPEKGTAQMRAWKEGLKEGWEYGVERANEDFERDLALLKRDYSGMMRYIDLVNKGVMAPPRLAADKQGIVISGDGKSLNVGDELVTIESRAAFQHQEKWETRGERHE